jgi:hypothetical protein
MTLAQLRAELNRIADDDIDTANADSWFNKTYQEVARANNGKWSWLETSTTIPLVAATYAYPIADDAADFRELIDIRNIAEGYMLTEDSGENFIKSNPSYPTGTSVATGKPTNFFITNGVINLYPIPDDAYTLTMRYYKNITELSGLTDVALIPSAFHEILVYGALVRYLISEDPADGAITRYQQEFDRIMQELKSSDKDGRTLNVMMGV